MILRGLSIAAMAVASAWLLPVASIAQQPAPIAAAVAAAELIDSSSKPDAAVAAWRQVIALHGDAPQRDVAAIARAYNKIGDAFYYAGKPDQSIVELEKARDLLVQSGLRQSDAMAETLANLGTMYSATGNAQKDLDTQREGLAIATALHGPDDSRLAVNYFNLGNALFELGYPAEAADAVEKGARMRITTMKPDNPELFMSLASAANIIGQAGRSNTSIDFAEQSVTMVSTHFPANHPYAGFVRATLGKTLLEGRRSAEAVEVLRKALGELAAAMGQDTPLTLEVMGNLAVALGRIGQFEEARVLQLRSIGNERTRERKPAEAILGLLSASNFAAEANDEAEALKLGEEGYAFAAAKLPPDHRVRGQMAATLAAHLARRGETARALVLMREAAAAYAAHLDADDPRRLDAEVMLGALEIAAREPAGGYQRVEVAARTLETQLRDNSDDPRLGNLANGSYDVFARAAEAAIAAGRGEDAFRYFQLAAYNVNSVVSQQVALRHAAGLAADQVRAMQDRTQARRALAVQHASLLASGNIARAKVVQDAMASAGTDIAALRARIEAQVPGYDRFASPPAIALVELQRRLVPGEALYVALPARMGTSMMLVTRDKVHLAFSRLPRSAVRAMVGKLRRAIDGALTQGGGAAFDLAASHQMYSMLFPLQFRSTLKTVRKLHVAASDALAELPFAALVTEVPRGTGEGAMRGAHWLIRDTSLEVPVTIASIGKKTVTRPATVAFGGIGAPVLDGKPGDAVQYAGVFRGLADVKAVRALPPLPGAAAELQAMGDAFGRSQSVLVTGDAAREGRVKAMDLTRFSVLAFATHGLIANEIDGLAEPALVLTPPRRVSVDDDGLLTSSEIGAMRIAADWVILSACNTASGVTQAAPSYTGLAHAFLYAGARSLLLSHWQVRDDAAARLSVAAVRGTANGLDRPEALRRAMLALMADRTVKHSAHPAVWAPFILVRD